MSSNSNHETDSAKPAKQDSNHNHDHSSIGARVGEGISGAMKIIHGIGESIRGHAIDIADLGHGSGKTIAADGKTEAKEGAELVEDSLHR